MNIGDEMCMFEGTSDRMSDRVADSLVNEKCAGGIAASELQMS